jgi:hypothetical protein
VTYTYAKLVISLEAYREIRGKLDEAGYNEQFHSDLENGELIDMHGVALAPDISNNRERLEIYEMLRRMERQHVGGMAQMYKDAADEIARLRSEVDRLERVRLSSLRASG